MGTRADFYVGRGKDAEWIGSIAWDGYPEGIDTSVLAAQDEQRFREAVTLMLSEDKSGMTPKMGWPWPWDDSGMTDYAYMFDGDVLWVSCFGSEACLICDYDPDKEDVPESEVFPDMSAKSKLTMGPRSGLIVVDN